MKLFTILLASLISIPMVQGQGFGDKKSKARELYYKYEREDVSMFRDRVSFQMPEPEIEREKEPLLDENGEALPEPQSLSYVFTPGKKVHVEADYRLEALVNADIAIKSRIETLNGYRIQLYAGRGESGAQRIKGRFYNLFPDYAAYLTFKSPNYVVRVGDFLDKEDVTIFTRQIREHFPGAFPVPDRVKVPKYRPGMED
ncbi:MAG: SPOR domain-containing protein [Bacteroidia bacterium]|nr:SPOR domain-containing protein [Bacteroidia bacterium]